MFRNLDRDNTKPGAPLSKLTQSTSHQGLSKLSRLVKVEYQYFGLNGTTFNPNILSRDSSDSC
jgi:hypothetical protein